MSNPTRVQAGVPSGGQFAPEHLHETDVELSATSPLPPVVEPSSTSGGFRRWDSLNEDSVIHLNECAWNDEGDIVVGDLLDANDFFDDSEGVVKHSVRAAQHADGSMVLAWAEAGQSVTTYRGSATEPSESRAGAVGHSLVYDVGGRIALDATGKVGEFDDAEILGDEAFKWALAQGGRRVFTSPSGQEVLDLTDNGNYAPMHARVVMYGDRYGLNDALVHDSDRPMVEFYDARYPHTEFGQFVSRYYLADIAVDTAHDTAPGLDLHGGVDEWGLTGQARTDAARWAAAETQRRRSE